MAQSLAAAPDSQVQNKASISVENFTVMPKSFEEFFRFANMVAASDLVPKDYKDKPGNVMVALQMGAEIGLKPMQALQNIAVINGRPSLWGDAVLALIQGSGLLEDFKEWTEGDTAHCLMKRKGYSQATERSFSDTDAKAAGLLGKAGPWTNYKGRMRQMRARGFCARDTFADLLRGFWVAEESQDTKTTEDSALSEAYMPKRASQAQPNVVEAEKIQMPETGTGTMVHDPVDPEDKISNAHLAEIMTGMKAHGVSKAQLVSYLKDLGHASPQDIKNGQYKDVLIFLETVNQDAPMPDAGPSA